MQSQLCPRIVRITVVCRVPPSVIANVEAVTRRHSLGNNGVFYVLASA
jgi:hypothetical protein